jgi:hypothetical protein
MHLPGEKFQSNDSVDDDDEDDEKRDVQQGHHGLQDGVEYYL